MSRQIDTRLPDELIDLLVSNATEGLEPERRASLETLLIQHPDADAEGMEYAATLAHLALLDAMPSARERMPDDVRARLLSTALGAGDGAEPVNPAPAPRDARRRAGDLGWYIAAGVALAWGGTVLLNNGGLNLTANPFGDQPVVDAAGGEGGGAVEAPSAPSASERRDALLASAGDVRTAAWAAKVSDYDGVSGDVVWSNERQEGYMRLVSMPRNEPALAQYQLWIVDPSRDEEPVDGGVFDVADGSEVVVPIDAKLEVIDPAAFAITREKPGGVVVSEGPLLVVAAL